MTGRKYFTDLTKCENKFGHFKNVVILALFDFFLPYFRLVGHGNQVSCEFQIGVFQKILLNWFISTWLWSRNKKLGIDRDWDSNWFSTKVLKFCSCWFFFLSQNFFEETNIDIQIHIYRYRYILNCYDKY